MPLVEVVKGDKTAVITLQKTIAFVRQIDRLPLPVKSRAGFLVNRVLMPYLMEAMKLSEEGISIAVIDKVAREFGMPMGPIELADAVGLDVCLSVAKNLSEHFSIEVPSPLLKKVEQGHLGKKTNQGFYSYQRGKQVKVTYDQKAAIPNDLCFRLIMPMMNEAAACLREQVVENADLLDAGMIFGTGFAPFRGGPMQYAQTLGKTQLAEVFHELQQQHGSRFRPDESWQLDPRYFPTLMSKES
jgi:3-hydroxyacyl-CoA dehydrogenase / enoyl-CoA hydratase / 3-hydroxybutyryl-CoA epimerase